MGFGRGPVAPLRGDDAREVLERRVVRVRAEPGLDGSPGAVHVSPLERRLDLLDRHGGILARSRPGALRQAQHTHEPQDSARTRGRRSPPHFPSGLMELLERRERRVGLRDAALAAIDAREREVRLRVGRIRGGGTQQRLHGSVRAVALPPESCRDDRAPARRPDPPESASLNSASASSIWPLFFRRMPRFRNGHGHFSPASRARRIASRYWRMASSGWFSAS